MAWLFYYSKLILLLSMIVFYIYFFKLILFLNSILASMRICIFIYTEWVLLWVVISLGERPKNDAHRPLWGSTVLQPNKNWWGKATICWHVTKIYAIYKGKAKCLNNLLFFQLCVYNLNIYIFLYGNKKKIQCCTKNAFKGNTPFFWCCSNTEKYVNFFS